MPKIVVEIEWDQPDEQCWLNAKNVETALAAYCKNTAFDVVELVAEDETPLWTEMRYEWASIINRLACIALEGALNFTENDRYFAQDMIEMVNPYLGLAEE